MTRPRAVGRWGRIAAGVVLALLSTMLVVPAAQAATTYGTLGPSYSGVTHPPTSDKPQSKLWWNDGSWWAYMWVTGSGWHIERLDRGTESWVDTGVTVDTRATTLGDTLWDGTHLFIASHVATVSSGSTTVVSQSGQPARLYRYSYSGGTYTLDAGFPTQINNNSSESLTIDEDSNGFIWATWTQVSGNASAGYTNTVYVNYTSAGGTTWQSPFVVPGASDPNPSPDDISAVVAFQQKIGVMWSDESTGTVWWAWRNDGAPPTLASSWHVSEAVRGPNQADDHLNLKTLQADSAGRVFAAIKTSFDENGPPDTQAQVQLLVFKPATGSFDVRTVSTIADCPTRPQVVLDESTGLIHVYLTGPSTDVSGCPYPGAPGAIYEKTAPMDLSEAFPSGRGTPVIQDGSDAHVNNVTTSKQPVNATTGIVVLASNDTTKRYWFADSAPTQPAPVASFTVSPTSGVAPLDVVFTDTSSGVPTSWSWDFGDGSPVSTQQNPGHTYADPGSYTVALTATNAAGSNTVTTVGAVSATAPSTGGQITVGASTTNSSAAVTDVTLDKPTGVVAGDVLIAQFNADNAPTVAAVPDGWSQVVTTTMSPGGGSSLFVYYRVVSDPAGEPASWTWTLSSAQKFGAGMTVYHGVDTTNPFDTAWVATVNNSASTTLSLDPVTTLTPDALILAGVGINSGIKTSSPPSGWSEAWESVGVQNTSLSSVTQAMPGSTGTVTITLSESINAAAWMRALRPAPPAPVASFTVSPASGVAPLDVVFTDTSSGSPTSWSWDFGDGSAPATSQNPSHTYTAAGSYTVALTATNASGSNTKTTPGAVTVGAPAPVAADGAVSTTQGVPVDGTLEVSSSGGGALTFEVVDQGAKGTAVVTDAASGAFTYTPDAGQSGGDAFTFRVSEAGVWSNVATMSVSIAADDPPFGQLDGVGSPAGGQVRVIGWAADADLPDGPLQVEVYIDGVLNGEITADKARPDVAAAFPGFGGDLGFDSTVTVAATGTVTVCATAVNEGPGGTDTELGCDTVDVAAADDPPFGQLDGVGSPAGGQVRVIGWAADADLPDGPLQVEVYIDGVLNGEITADKARPDVAAAFPGFGGDLGFDSTVTVAATGTVTVCATAVNEGPGGTDTELGCDTVDVAAADDPPFGQLDGVGSPAGGQVRVIGWAADADLPDGPLQVEVYIDGVLNGEITADKARPDVAAAFPGFGGDLGFDSTVTVAATGTVTVCATAVNEGPGGTDTELGCDTVDVAAADDPPFGQLDGVGSPAGGQVRVIGWAADADLPDGPLQVEVYIDGVLNGEITADKARPDVAAAFPGFGGDLGFDSTVTVAATGTVTVCATAVNEGPGGTDTELGCDTVDVAAADDPPFGQLDGVGSPAGGQVRVIGWAADADLPDGPLQVEVYIDGVLNGEITADKARPDVAAAFPGFGGDLGFDSTVTVAATGTVTVCATAVNEGPGGTDTELGCQAVEVT